MKLRAEVHIHVLECENGQRLGYYSHNSQPITTRTSGPSLLPVTSNADGAITLLKKKIIRDINSIQKKKKKTHTHTDLWPLLDTVRRVMAPSR